LAILKKITSLFSGLKWQFFELKNLFSKNTAKKSQARQERDTPRTMGGINYRATKLLMDNCRFWHLHYWLMDRLKMMSYFSFFTPSPESAWCVSPFFFVINHLSTLPHHQR